LSPLVEVEAVHPLILQLQVDREAEKGEMVMAPLLEQETHLRWARHKVMQVAGLCLPSLSAARAAAVALVQLARMAAMMVLMIAPIKNLQATVAPERHHPSASALPLPMQAAAAEPATDFWALNFTAQGQEALAAAAAARIEFQAELT
jgi:hypothetical protein